MRLDLRNGLWAPVDAASLAVFRIAFGALLAWEVGRYFFHGWVKSQYIDPIFHFTYYGFGWVRPWGGQGMYWHFALLGVLALFVALGLFYRVSALLLFLAYAYVFLLDETFYQNHLYLIALLAFLLATSDAHRAFSIDARRARGGEAEVVPAWQLYLLRGQIALVYLFGALAKLNGAWLRGEPLRGWLAGKASLPLLGPLLALPFMPYAFSYGGLLVDLSLPVLLSFRRTRALGVAIGLVFHLTNFLLWDIGIFPPLMIAALFLFFPPDWPRKFLASRPPGTPRAPSWRSSNGKLAGLALYAAMQVFLPLRSWLYPGDACWTREGDRFAWRMKLYDIDGKLRLLLLDPRSGRKNEVPYRKILSSEQADVMETDPDMILQFCHYLAALRASAGLPPIAIFAVGEVSVNGSPPRRVIDPSRDLTREKRGLRHAPWIYPVP